MNSNLDKNLFSASNTPSPKGSHARLTKKDPKRLLLTAKVLPKTVEAINELRGGKNGKSIGKLLDETIGKATPHPPGWGNDELTFFLKVATENGYATYVREKQFWPRLQQIDSVFYRISQNMDNTRDWFYTLFYFRTHSIWRAAIRLAVSGQNPETHILLRSCLENALYAFFINNDKVKRQNKKSRFLIWMNREDSPTAEKQCRDFFKIGKIISELKIRDGQLGEIAERIYKQSISQGAHPNVHGTLSHINMWSDKKERGIETQYLNCENAAFRFALKRACQAGLCFLLIFKIIFKERFDILGISDEIEKLKQGL